MKIPLADFTDTNRLDVDTRPDASVTADAEVKDAPLGDNEPFSYVNATTGSSDDDIVADSINYDSPDYHLPVVHVSDVEVGCEVVIQVASAIGTDPPLPGYSCYTPGQR